MANACAGPFACVSVRKTRDGAFTLFAQPGEAYALIVCDGADLAIPSEGLAAKCGEALLICADRERLVRAQGKCAGMLCVLFAPAKGLSPEDEAQFSWLAKSARPGLRAPCDGFVHALIGEMLVLKHTANAENDVISAHLFMAILARLRHLATSEDARRKKCRAAQIKQYIEARYDDAFSLAHLAGHFNMSETYLQRIFREEYGVTVMCYVSRYRIQMAADMIRSGKRNLTDIAYLTGFNSRQSFYGAFHKHMTMSPKQYINMMDDKQ